MLEFLQTQLSLAWLNYTLSGFVVLLSYCLLYYLGGLLSFGHAVYVGAGAYAAVYALNAWGCPIMLLPLLAGIFAGLLALVLGYLCTRKAGASFAMITLGIGELLRSLSQSWPAVFGGEAGFSINRGLVFGAESLLFGLCLAYALLLLGLVLIWLRSQDALYLQACKDNAERLRFLGVSPTAVNYRAFCLVAGLAGVAGSLQVLQFEHVNNSVFSAEKSGAYLLFAYLGLAISGHLLRRKSAVLVLAAALGAVLMSVSQTWLPRYLPYSNLLLGLLFMAVVFVQSRNRKQQAQPFVAPSSMKGQSHA